jgi:hypothetical protein
LEFGARDWGLALDIGISIGIDRFKVRGGSEQLNSRQQTKSKLLAASG